MSQMFFSGLKLQIPRSKRNFASFSFHKYALYARVKDGFTSNSMHEQGWEELMMGSIHHIPTETNGARRDLPGSWELTLI